MRHRSITSESTAPRNAGLWSLRISRSHDLGEVPWIGRRNIKERVQEVFILLAGLPEGRDLGLTHLVSRRPAGSGLKLVE